MNSIFTFLLIAGIAAAVLYTFFKTKSAKNNTPNSTPIPPVTTPSENTTEPDWSK